MPLFTVTFAVYQTRLAEVEAADADEAALLVSMGQYGDNELLADDIVEVIAVEGDEL